MPLKEVLVVHGSVRKEGVSETRSMTDRNAEQEAREIVSLYVHNHGRHGEPLACPSCKKLCTIIATALQRRDDRIKQTEIQNERLRGREADTLRAAAQVHDELEAQVRALRTALNGVQKILDEPGTPECLDCQRRDDELVRLRERLSQIDSSRGLADPNGEGLETVEHIAAELHEQYRAAARHLGWQMKPEVDVPYSLLQEDAKELDRVFARWHLAGLDALKAQHEAALREVEEFKRKYHDAMDVLTDYDKIDHATALAQLAEAHREIERLRKALKRIRSGLRGHRDLTDIEMGVLADKALATPPAPEGEKGRV